MKQNIKLLLVSIIVFIVLPWILSHLIKDDSYITETSVNAYKTRDTLYPDYVHTDTLIVLDGTGLEEEMRIMKPSSDGEIADVLYHNCISLQEIKNISNHK